MYHLLYQDVLIALVYIADPAMLFHYQLSDLPDGKT